MKKSGREPTFEVGDIDGVPFVLVSWQLPEGNTPALTDAEHDVLRRVMNGESNRVIAAARGTSQRTVANQLATLFRKFEVGSRVELVARLARASKESK